MLLQRQHSVRLSVMAGAMNSYQAGSLVGTLLIPVVLLVVLLCLSVKWVPRHHVRYVMRRRKWWYGPPRIYPTHTYHRTLKPGLRIVVPGIDQVTPPAGWPDNTVLPARHGSGDHP